MSIKHTYINATQNWHNLQGEGNGFITNWSFSPGSSCVMWPSQNGNSYNFYLSCSSSISVGATNFCGTEIINPVLVIGYGWRFYPNPAKDKITIEFDTEYRKEIKKNTPLLVPDAFVIVNEKLLSIVIDEKSKSEENNINLDVSKLSTGEYYIHFTKNNKVIDRKKLIIK
jgi:hypothetical protein